MQPTNNLPPISIHDLRNSGALVTSVPTIQQLRQSEFDKHVSDNLTLHEFIKGVRDQIRASYPQASSLLLASTPIDKEHTQILLEYTGSEAAMQAALCEAMQQAQYAINLVNNAMFMFINSASPKEAERAISVYQDFIRDIERHINPFNRLTMIDAEIKRLRRDGNTDLIAVKMAERKTIEDEIDKARRKKERRTQLCQYLVKARARKAELREERKRKELNRRNNPQPNFAKMAKQRRQQLAARKTEKKKKSSSGSGEAIHSCSQLLKAN